MSGRAPGTENLQLGRGKDPVLVAGLIMKGLQSDEIRKRLKMSAAGYDAQITSMVEISKARFETQKPRPGSGWWIVPFSGGEAAVGYARGKRYRLLDFANGPNANEVIRSRLNAGQINTPDGGSSTNWLGRIIAGSQDWPEIEKRLWIALARTAAWL